MIDENAQGLPIGNIQNHYGGLHLIVDDNKYYWGIEDYWGTNWEEIPEHLYLALIKFNREKNKND